MHKYREQFDTTSYRGDYQHRAMTSGNPMQRFWHAQKIELVKAKFKVSTGDTVLDAGCGSGNIIISLADNIKRGMGVDINPNTCKYGSSRCVREQIFNTQFLVSSIDSLAFRDGSIDKIILSEVLEHVPYPEKILPELHRVLKPSGKMFITTPNYRSLWPLLENVLDCFKLVPSLDDQHVKKYTRSKLVHVLAKNGFKLLEIGSFFSTSPFIALLSTNLAYSFFHKEINKRSIFNLPGMLLYGIFEKS